LFPATLISLPKAEFFSFRIFFFFFYLSAAFLAAFHVFFLASCFVVQGSVVAFRLLSTL
jgi:hypothetical protein